MCNFTEILNYTIKLQKVKISTGIHVILNYQVKPVQNKSKHGKT